MKKFGVVIYRKEKEAEYKKIFNDCFKKIKESGGFKDGEHHMPFTLESEIVLVQITPDAFRSYVHFDNFLSSLAENLNDGIYDIGLVLGHNNKDGFFWTEDEWNQKDEFYWLKYMSKGAGYK